MNIMAIQTDIAWEDKPVNYQRVLELVESAEPAPGCLITLPEMFATGFSMNVSEIARYCKRHPFSFANETDHYESGEEIVCVSIGDVHLTPFICYDLRFPEAFRLAVRRGTTLFVVIANWPSARKAHWDVLLKARAIENQAYVVGVNRCGKDPKNSYSGHSIVISPLGESIISVSDEPGALKASLDVKVLESYRRLFPALQDMKLTGEL